MPIRIAIHGAAGRMGQRLVALAGGRPASLKIVAALEHAGHPQLGNDAGTIAGRRRAGRAAGRYARRAHVDVVIDFSVPDAARGDRRALPGDARFRWSWPRPASTPSSRSTIRKAADDDSARLVAQHEPGGEPGDEARRDRRPRR